MKSMKKHETESRTRSKVSPIIALKEPLDSRLVVNAGIDYIKDYDILQVKLQ